MSLLKWLNPATFLIGAFLLVASCSPRGEIVEMTDPGLATTTETVLVSTTRKPETTDLLSFAEKRSSDVSFARFEVSIPPDRELGSVKLPRPQNPNPQREFLVAESRMIKTERAFVAEVNRKLAMSSVSDRDGVIFVHGYNTSFAEGLYRQAQLQHDMQRHGATVHFSWPSHAKTTNYLGDRESALYSRDGLANTITAMATSNIRSLDLVAHSMGTFLLMETLRGMAHSGETRALRRVGSVVLMSADIDIDVFITQAKPVLAQGIPIYLLVSKSDKALFLSSVLRGTPDRLGSITDEDVLQGLDVVVVDLSDVESEEFLGHFKEGNSEALIQFVRQVHAQGGEIFTQGKRAGVLETDVSLVQSGGGLRILPRTGW